MRTMEAENSASKIANRELQIGDRNYLDNFWPFRIWQNVSLTLETTKSSAQKSRRGWRSSEENEWKIKSTEARIEKFTWGKDTEFLVSSKKKFHSFKSDIKIKETSRESKW